jgi:AraC-like DNA-binding protein
LSNASPSTAGLVAAALLIASVLQLLWLAGHLAAQKRFRHLATGFLCVALAGLALRMGKSSLNAFVELTPALRNLGLAGMLAVPPALFGHWSSLRRATPSRAALAGIAAALGFALLAPWIPNVPGDPASRAVYAGILAWGFAWAAWGWWLPGREGAVTHWIRAGALALAGAWTGFLGVFVAGANALYVAWCVAVALASTVLVAAWVVHPAISNAYARLLRGAAESDAELERARQLLARLVKDEVFRDPDLTLARFARRVGVPEKQLSRLLTLVPPHHFRAHLNRIRIEAARRALEAGWRGSLTELALHSGYNSSAAFSRAFRAETGTPPSAWKPV